MAFRVFASVSRPLFNYQRLVAEARAKVPEVTPKQVAAMVGLDGAAKPADVAVIDVREQNEWAQKRVAAPKVVHLSKGVLERDVAKVVPSTDTPIVLYCAGGMRSLLAGEALLRMGYKNVKSMSGGIQGWRQAGLPVDEAPPK